jgi:hypothetical protein
MILLHSPPQTGGGVSIVYATNVNWAKERYNRAMMPEPPAAWNIPTPGRVANTVSINVRIHGLVFAIIRGKPAYFCGVNTYNPWR